MYMYTYIVHENSEINGILITRDIFNFINILTHIYISYISHHQAHLLNTYYTTGPLLETQTMKQALFLRSFLIRRPCSENSIQKSVPRVQTSLVKRCLHRAFPLTVNEWL